MRYAVRYALLILGALAPTFVTAGPLPQRFTLAKYVPDDVWLYVHSVDNPERAWIRERWADIFKTLEGTGIDRDIKSLVLSAVPDEDRAEWQANIDEWTGLIKSVRWGELVEHEFVLAERLQISSSGPKNPMGADYILLARGRAGSAEHNAAALATVLKEAAELDQRLSLAEAKHNGVSQWTLTIKLEENDHAPINIVLLNRGDIIGLTNSAAAAADVVALMTGKGKKSSMASSRRLQEALDKVKAPEDEVSYFDLRSFVASITGVMQRVITDKKNGFPEDVRKRFNVVTKLASLGDVIDYIITTSETEGLQQRSYSVTQLIEGKQKCKLASCFLDRKPFRKFDEFIPEDALEFSVNSLLDFEALYKLVIDFVRDEIPGGAEGIETWNGLLASIDFDPHRDVFSWWSGEMVSVKVPPAFVTPMGGGSEFVYMFRVKDPELASRKINVAIDFVNRKLQDGGQKLLVMPAPVDAEGFRQVTHPIVMMFLNPVIGVKGEWLMIGQSPAAVNKCLAVAAGKAPSIVKNDRFRREGLVPKGPVVSCSFKDTSTFGQELGAMVGMVGLASGMVTATIPDEDAKWRKAKKIIQSLASIIMKLGPVFQKLDFYSSEASMSTYDNRLTVRKETVVTYRRREANEVKTAEVK